MVYFRNTINLHGMWFQQDDTTHLYANEIIKKKLFELFQDVEYQNHVI